jgi:hypothetical protein
MRGFHITTNIFSSKGAIEYSEKNKLEEWVHLFLNSEGNNIGFSTGLLLVNRHYIKPQYLPLSLFSRCCGPENGMKYLVSVEEFEKKVEKIKERIINGWDIPPLIINYTNNVYELNDGNHRYEALVRLGYTNSWVIIWITEEKDYFDYIRKNPLVIEKS